MKAGNVSHEMIDQFLDELNAQYGWEKEIELYNPYYGLFFLQRHATRRAFRICICSADGISYENYTTYSSAENKLIEYAFMVPEDMPA